MSNVQELSEQQQRAEQQIRNLLLDIGQNCLAAEREAFARDGHQGLERASFLLRRHGLPAAKVQHRVEIFAGLMGTVLLIGQNMVTVRLICKDVRAWFAGHAAAGRPVPEMGVDPVQLLKRLEVSDG